MNCCGSSLNSKIGWMVKYESNVLHFGVSSTISGLGNTFNAIPNYG